MKSFKKLFVVFAVCSSSMVLPMKQHVYEFNKSTIMAHGLGKIGVTYDKEGFKVHEKNKISKVNTYDLDHSLRNIDTDRLSALEKMGACLLVKKFDNGDFKLGLTSRLKGGGPICGALGYWGTKIGAYMTLGSAAVVSTAAATGALSVGVTGGAIIGTANAVIAVNAPLGAGATLVAGGMVGTGTVAGVAGAASLQTMAAAGVVATGIESTSLTVGAWLLAIPFLP